MRKSHALDMTKPIVCFVDYDKGKMCVANVDEIPRTGDLIRFTSGFHRVDQIVHYPYMARWLNTCVFVSLANDIIPDLFECPEEGHHFTRNDDLDEF